jgi:hypothetical protein
MTANKDITKPVKVTARDWLHFITGFVFATIIFLVLNLIISSVVVQ